MSTFAALVRSESKNKITQHKKMCLKITIIKKFGMRSEFYSLLFLTFSFISIYMYVAMLTYLM